MPQGMVISLKMKNLVSEMGDRGSKSVVVVYGNCFTVKEQRVDGSSDSRDLVSVWCTLVAWESRFLGEIK